MKIGSSTRTFLLVVAAIALVATPAIVAQVQKMETFSITIVPTLSVGTQAIPLGTVQGGSSQSQTFNDAVGVQSITAGTRAVSMSLSANSTLFSKFDVSYIYLGSDVCDLALNSPTCSFTVSLSANSAAYFNAVVVYTTVDGFSATTDPSVIVSVS